MAIMSPKSIENYNYTATEKQLYDALREQLSDKYNVFYSVRWFDTIDHKRVDSECDFLVFDPSFGYITIEVKGGTGIKYENDTWTLIEDYSPSNSSTRVLKCSPYEQAEKSMYHFKDYFVSEYGQKYNGVYGFAVCFPRYAINEPLNHDAPIEATIDMNDMDNLQEKINKIFHYWKNKRNISVPFSADQRKRLINSLDKQVSMAAAAGALIPIKQKEFSKIDFVQEAILDCLYNYNQVQIMGGAGTGKTFIAMKKAIRDCLDGKNVLFTCCSKDLACFIRKKLDCFQDIVVYCYEELMQNILGDIYSTLQCDVNGQRQCFEAVTKILDRMKFDSIIVDEAQDFSLDMGLTIKSLLLNEELSTLYVFYDKNQNVFKMDFENAFAIDAKPYVLRYNIRNTGSIYKYAVDRTKLGEDTVANSIFGVEPEIHSYNSKVQAIKAISTVVNRLVKKEYVPTHSIVIVSDIDYPHSILANEKRVGAYNIVNAHFHDVGEGEICFKTVEEFKGLEADVVLYLNHNFVNLPKSNNNYRKDYVAITRARYYLYIIDIKCNASFGV